MFFDGRQRETTPVKYFPRKISMERIFFIVIADTRWSMALGEKKCFSLKFNIVVHHSPQLHQKEIAGTTVVQHEPKEYLGPIYITNFFGRFRRVFPFQVVKM